MKFKTTENINLRATPSVDGTLIVKIPKGTILEGDEHVWKAVTLSDGKKGYCAATYLEDVIAPPIATRGKWYAPIRLDKFKVTQKYLEPDAITYPLTKHHPGVDYSTQGDQEVPLYFCADGEVLESGFHAQFGNYFFYYVPEADRTFVYFHLRDAAPVKGTYKGGEQCGITGTTGKSTGAHLHLECLKGRKTSVNRSALYTSKKAVISAGEDADIFLRTKLI